MRKKWDLANVIFYMVFCIYVLKIMLGRISALEQIKDFLSIIQISFLCIGICIQSNKYQYNTFFKIIIVVIIGLISYFISEDTTIIFLYLYVFFSRKINIDELIKFDIKFKILLLFINAWLLLLGVVENIVFYRDDGSVRNTFGFESPNTIGMILLSIFIEIAYISRKKISGVYFLGILITVIILNLIFDSRASSICFILLAILLVFKNVFKYSIIKKFLPYMMLIFSILSILLVYLYKNNTNIGIILNEVFSTRLSIANEFFKNYKINLLGNRFKEYDYWIGYVNTLDNAYINLLLKHGVLNYIIVLFFNIKIMKKFVKEENYVGIVCLIVMYAYGMMEKATFVIIYNMILFELKDVIYFKEIKKEKNNE